VGFNKQPENESMELEKPVELQEAVASDKEEEEKEAGLPPIKKPRNLFSK
jgi:hypothetical protein